MNNIVLLVKINDFFTCFEKVKMVLWEKRYKNRWSGNDRMKKDNRENGEQITRISTSRKFKINNI